MYNYVENWIQSTRYRALVDRIHAENIGCEYGEYVDQ